MHRAQQFYLRGKGHVLVVWAAVTTVGGVEQQCLEELQGGRGRGAL